MGEASKTVSVIVPAYNARETLPGCLGAISRQSASGGPRDRYEVIVVDDGSTDDTGDIAEQAGVKTIRQPHRGPAAARNQGSQIAQGEILVFTDADCTPAPDWLANLVKPLEEDPTIAAAKGAYLTQQKGLVARLVQLEYEEKYRRLALQPFIDFIDSYSAAYRRDAFLAEGGFDTAFPVPSAEDQELSFRLWRKGARMVFVPKAIVFHRHPDTWWKYARRKVRFGYWQILNRWKHPEKLGGDSHTPLTQRFQLLAMGLLVMTVALTTLAPGLGLALSAILFTTFLMSEIPLIRIAVQQDPAVVWAVPILPIVRAGALLIGILAGMLTLPLRGRLGMAALEDSPAPGVSPQAPKEEPTRHG